MSDYTAAELISYFATGFTDDCCWYAGAAFLVYDWVITFGDEVDLFWRRRWTGSTLLFVLNRYIALLGIVMAMLELARLSNESCANIVKAQGGFNYLQYLPWAAFSGLRAYALSEKNVPISLLVVLLGLVPFGINMGQYAYGLTGTYDEIFGCSASLPITEEFARKITIASRTCLMGSDVLLIAITWYSTLKWRVPHDTSAWSSSSLSSVLLRDGTIYFILLLVLNSLHLTFTMLSIDAIFEPLSYFSDFTEPFTTVLVSRFLIDLQSANRRALKLESRDPLYWDSDTAFVRSVHPSDRVIGALGSSLVFHHDDALGSDCGEESIPA